MKYIKIRVRNNKIECSVIDTIKTGIRKILDKIKKIFKLKPDMTPAERFNAYFDWDDFFINMYKGGISFATEDLKKDSYEGPFWVYDVIHNDEQTNFVEFFMIGKHRVEITDDPEVDPAKIKYMELAYKLAKPLMAKIDKDAKAKNYIVEWEKYKNEIEAKVLRLFKVS